MVSMNTLEKEFLITQNEFLRKLLAKEGEFKSFKITNIVVSDPVSLTKPPYSLLDSLGIENKALSDKAKITLDAINEINNKTLDSDWIALQWKFSAFLHIQDIFEILYQPIDKIRLFFQQYYFYFESRVILAESFLAGLNGLYIASDSLLRLFLEFNLLQNYFYRLTKMLGNDTALKNYFSKGQNPNWGTILKKSLPTDSFSRPILSRIKAELSGLSTSSSHPYHPYFSPSQYRRSLLGHSLEGIFFWNKIRLIMDSVLWLYYVNFPLLFHPVDILHKFGYKAPIGIVIDSLTNTLVKRSLSDQDYKAFQQYSSQQDSAIEIIRSINELPNLTDEEICSTWNSENGVLGDILEGYCKQNAKIRGIRMGMAFKLCEKKCLPDNIINSFNSLEGWKKISQKFKTGHRQLFMENL